MTGLESIGWALQGTYVYNATYPDFYATCLNEKMSAVSEQMTLNNETITVYRCENGHIYYDIADKSKVDAYYQISGAAWFYGVDTVNERIFLPRKKNI